MAFTTPPTFPGSYQILSSDLNSYWTNDLVWLNTAHGCRIYKTGTPPTCPNNGTLIITYDSEFWNSDSNAFHSTSSNTDRITIGTGFDGKYDFTGSIAWNVATGGYRQVNLLQNGATVAFSQIAAASTGECTQNFSFSGIVAAANDYFQIQVKQTSGSGLTVLTSATYSTWVSAERRGA